MRFPKPLARRLRAARAAVRAIRNPATGHPVGRVAVSGPREVARAAAAVTGAFARTAALPAHVRADVLRRVADGIARRRKTFVARIVREAGKPVRYAEAEVDRALATFRLAAEEATRIGGELIPTDIAPRGEGYVTLDQRVPAGPVLAITPFNFPLNLAAHKVAPALAAGCPVLLKPPPQAPGCAFLLEEIVRETPWPRDGFRVVFCENDQAERLARDDRFAVLSFTGSDLVGWRLKAIAGKKRVILELGGNAGLLVEPDADLAWAVARAAAGAFAYAGQTCISVQRVFVHARVYRRFASRFADAARAFPTGDPSDPRVENGPLIDDAARDRVLSWIDEARRAGARILAGGRPAKGFRNTILPTVVAEADPSLKICCEEAFGPVAVIAPYRTFEEGLTKLNASRYGLQAAVFTRDIRKIDRANRFLRVGGLVVNDAPTFRMDNAPYGGVKDSGLGREGVRYAVAEMTDHRLLVIHTAH